jgi:hypothetical protein
LLFTHIGECHWLILKLLLSQFFKGAQSRAITGKALPLLDKVRIAYYGDNVSDHYPVEIDLNLCLSTLTSITQTVNSSIVWSKLDESTLESYANEMEIFLDNIDVPFCQLVHDECICSNHEHKFLLEHYYDEILLAIKQADLLLPRTNVIARKPYWSPELSELKRGSVESHKIWVVNGKPKSGLFFDNMKDSRYKYRRALRIEKNEMNKCNNDCLYDGLINKEPVKFWKAWGKMNKSKVSFAPRIDGHVVEKDIASAFANFYHGVYTENDTDAHSALKDEFVSNFDT